MPKIEELIEMAHDDGRSDAYVGAALRTQYLSGVKVMVRDIALFDPVLAAARDVARYADDSPEDDGYVPVPLHTLAVLQMEIVNAEHHAKKFREELGYSSDPERFQIPACGKPHTLLDQIEQCPDCEAWYIDHDGFGCCGCKEHERIDAEQKAQITELEAKLAAAERLAEAVDEYKSARKKWTKRDRVLKHLCGKQHAAKRDNLLRAMLDARKNMEDLAAYIQSRKGQDDG